MRLGLAGGGRGQPLWAPSVECACIDTYRPMDVSKVKIKGIACRLPTHARAWTAWPGLFRVIL
jgi:hypothetical protein